MNLGWIALWYAFCGLVVKGFLSFYDLVNKPRFRDSAGDITTEVGYDEDPVGNPLQLNDDDECVDGQMPHVPSTTGGVF